MKNINIKPFIYSSTSILNDIPVIKETTNKYGVKIYFYLIDNNNVNLLREQEFKKDFKENKNDDFEWFLNRWAVAIVKNTSLLNKWLSKPIYLFLDQKRWTLRTVLIN